ncbi:hypothetical protein B0T09DRAFT_333261 [Sordaria sp. MPI-SDFR-AT-0083]|nr:hypothetical protein B0T09DRAFT_333261 [Sordaria sp. MPI-SDFR-AT-0083]
MGGVVDRGFDDSAENAAPVSRTVFPIAFAVECTVPLTPSPAEWARLFLLLLLLLLFLTSTSASRRA